MINLNSSSAVRHTLIAGAAALGLLAGLPLHAKKDPEPAAPTRPGTYEDWNDGLVNKLVIKESFKLADFTEVRVLPVDRAKTPLPDKDDNTYEPAVLVLNRSTDIMVEGMKGELKAPPVKTGDMPAPAAPPAAPSAAGSAAAPEPAAAPRMLVIRVRIVELNPGSRAARHWGGFGAGKSSVELEGDAIDSASGKVLLSFNITRASSGTWSLAGGGYEKLMTGDVEDAGSDVGKMLTFFK